MPVSTLAAAAPTVVRTYPVADCGTLLEQARTVAPFAWVRNGDGLVGWGEFARFEVGGPDRFAAAERWWNQLRAGFALDGPAGVDAPWRGPVAFASFGFDPAPGNSVLVVPQVVMSRSGGQTWVTIIGDGEAPLSVVGAESPAPSISYADGSLSPGQWTDAVREALGRIERGELDKVVLARDLLATADADIDQRRLLLRLAQRYPECWTFAVDGLVGATPELLIRRRGSAITSRVLAGTVRRQGDDAADAAGAAALQASSKEVDEHRFAVESVARALAEHCTELDVPAQPQVLRLANVQHLATDVTGQVSDGSTVLSLVRALHPTAAVCGTPTASALDLIREIEGMDRGRYAGPVGWLGADGDGEFGIALRCAQISGPTARLFAGCGIVAGSDPESELAEAQAKFVAIRDALAP
jgi:menaquinone-specific isochorismate synthase